MRKRVENIADFGKQALNVVRYFPRIKNAAVDDRLATGLVL